MSNESEAESRKTKEKYRIPNDDKQFIKVFKNIYKMMGLSLKGYNQTKLIFTDNNDTVHTYVGRMAKLYGMNLITLEEPEDIFDITQIPFYVAIADKEKFHVLKEEDIKNHSINNNESLFIEELKKLNFIDNHNYYNILMSSNQIKDMYKKYYNFIDKVRGSEEKGIKTILFIKSYCGMLNSSKTVRDFLDILLTENKFRNYDLSEVFIMGAYGYCKNQPHIPSKHQIFMTEAHLKGADGVFHSILDKYTPVGIVDKDEWLVNKLLNK